MKTIDTQASRPETLVAATLYLMTHYARTGCPRLAMCISKHLQCLAVHPGADQTVRDICAGVQGAWAQAAISIANANSGTSVH
jgi:hypothetical protein